MFPGAFRLCIRGGGADQQNYLDCTVLVKIRMLNKLISQLTSLKNCIINAFLKCRFTVDIAISPLTCFKFEKNLMLAHNHVSFLFQIFFFTFCSLQ